MSIQQYCSLCCKTYSEYKLLQNEVGDRNEIYEITIKYFDPMLFTEETNPQYEQEIKVLCQDCWLHINDFHEFQQTVITTRSALEKSYTIKQLELDIKAEIVQDDTILWADKETINNSEKEEYFENVINEDNSYNLTADTSTRNEEDNNDDEGLLMPLITLTKGTNEQNKNSENELNNLNNEKNHLEKEKPLRTLRDRKPKNYSEKALKYNITNKSIPSESSKNLELADNSKKVPISKIEKSIEMDKFIAKWKRTLECDLCLKTCKTFMVLEKHFKAKHKTRGYIRCCKRRLYSRYELVNHIRWHQNPEMHKCDICGKTTTNQYTLKTHKKIIHENSEKFVCNVCHKICKRKSNLERHMLRHVKGSKDFVCQECGKAYVHEIQLKYHIKSLHNAQDHVCGKCGKTIHGAVALRKHLKEHDDINKPKFPCDQCGKVLNSRYNLKCHIESFHNDGTAIYVCGICGKVASNEKALLYHKKNVHEERKHKCTYCEKAFNKPHLLREHIATHTGQHLYQCPHCSKTFQKSRNMTYHRKKVHPVEWEEVIKNRLEVPKININQVKYQVVL